MCSGYTKKAHFLLFFWTVENFFVCYVTIKRTVGAIKTTDFSTRLFMWVIHAKRMRPHQFIYNPTICSLKLYVCVCVCVSNILRSRYKDSCQAERHARVNQRQQQETLTHMLTPPLIAAVVTVTHCSTWVLDENL